MPRSILITVVLLVPVLTSCRNYLFTVNEREVYAPPRVFTDYRVVDAALGACLAQTLTDLKITRPGQLTRLVCTHANIADLSGLEVFTSLAQLNLAHNRLTDIRPLLYLNNLTGVDLSGNPGLVCADALLLQAHTEQLQLPSHCQDGT